MAVCASACAKLLPESVISHTLVTGGSVACAPLFGVLLVGALAALGAGVGVAAALGAAFEVFVAALDAPALADEAAGVGCGVTGGGCTAAAVLVLVVCVPPPPASAAIAGSSSGMRSPASEVSGAGPIAAPTATPIASIPAASAAATRVEGRRGGPLGAGSGGVSGGVGNGGVGWVDRGRSREPAHRCDASA